MRGSIQKRQGKLGVSYLVRVEYPPDPMTGQRRQRAETFPTRKQAETALAQWTAKVQTGTAVLPDKLVVGELMDRWLEDVAKHRLKETTWQGYRRTIVRHVMPKLGSISVQKLSAADVQRSLSALRSEGVGARSVQLAYMRLSQALNYAARMQLVSRNVCDLVDAPRAPAKRGQTWTAEEARSFLAKAEQATYAPLWHVLLAAGCRIGEALGAALARRGPGRWSHPHRANARHPATGQGRTSRSGLSDRRSRSGTARRGAAAGLSRPSSDIGQRRSKRFKAGTGWQDDAPRLRPRNGTPIDPNNARRVFDRRVPAADVPAIRLHDLRHTERMLADRSRRADSRVSERLGHARRSSRRISKSRPSIQPTNMATDDGGLLFDDAKTVLS